MTKASGPIKYMEHQTPMTDETGKHLVHPQFVNNGIHDFAAMTRSVAEHRLLGSPQYIAAIDAMEQDTLMALAMGKEVRIGNMFIVKPKLSVRHHTDADGTPYRNVYHEGDRIPPTDVSLTGIEVRPTKAFFSKFLLQHYHGCSRAGLVRSRQTADTQREFSAAAAICREKGFVTASDLSRHLNISGYMARKLLSTWCQGESPSMTCTKAGYSKLYQLMTTE